jgi:hypothetical protein
MAVTSTHRRRRFVPLAVVPLGVVALIASFSGVRLAAAATPVGLGTASSFAVLAGTTVTNTGPSVISGDLGVSPGAAVTGFPPGLVQAGVIHAADAVAAQAQNALTTAYNDAAGQTPSTDVGADLTGQTLVPGLYHDASAGTIGLTGTVTLDAQGDPSAIFIFQAASTLITAPNSTVALINGASPCNVFWQVGSSATLGTNTTFVGTVMALTSIAAQTGATVQGRLLARNGAVTLDDNTITATACAAGPTTTTTTAAPSTSAGTPTTTATTTPGGTVTLVSVAPTVPGGGTIPGGGTVSPTAAPGGGVGRLPVTGSRSNVAFIAALTVLVGGALQLSVRRRDRRRPTGQ